MSDEAELMKICDDVDAALAAASRSDAIVALGIALERAFGPGPGAPEVGLGLALFDAVTARMRSNIANAYDRSAVTEQ